MPSFATAVWLVFLAWISLTSFWSIDPGTSVRTLTIAIPLVVLLFIASVMEFDEIDLDVWRLAIIAGGVLVGMYATVLIVKGGALPTHGVSQRFSIKANPQETDPNTLAASLILPLVLSTECLLLGGGKWLRRGTWRLIGGAGVVF